jgi:molybdopterin converting factor small subunit
MQVTIRLGEPFWRPLGRRELSLELGADARVADLLAALAALDPALAGELRAAPPQVFVGDGEADDATPLAPGARVHLLWPVAGG